MNEIEITVKVRVSRDGEYENTETFDISIPADTAEDDKMEVMMEELYSPMEDEYGDDEDWDNCNIDWTLIEWEEN
jgi:hypothetical protein